MRNHKIVIVEDVVSSVGAILEALSKLRADDVNPERALCVIDRETGGKEALADAGLELISVFTMNDIEAAAKRTRTTLSCACSFCAHRV